VKIKYIIPSIISGIFLILIFPKANLSFLAWVCLIPILTVVYKEKDIPSFKLGLICGFIANLGTLYWVVTTILADNQPLTLAILSLVSLSLYLAIFFGIFTWFFNLLSLRLPNYLVCIGGAALWVTLEWVRGVLLGGFPWLLIGYSQWRWIRIIQIVEYTGVYGLSFLILIVNIAFIVILQEFELFRKRPSRVIPYILPFLLVFLAHLYGNSVIRSGDYEFDGKSVRRVAILQGSTDQYKKWNRSYRKEIMGVYTNLVLRASEQNPDIVVWPESAVPGYMLKEADILKWIREVVKRSSIFHIIGSVHYIEDDYYNSAFLLSPRGNVLGRYDKTHLVPFGEFVPFRMILSKFIGVLNELGGFTDGDSYRLLNGYREVFGVLICFESIFPYISRRSVRMGADYLVNITNDAWFLKTAAPYQHYIMGTFRAIENRRCLIRAANTGISGIVDPLGRTLAKTELFEEGVLLGSVFKVDRLSFYTRFGDLFTYVCMIFTVFLVGPILYSVFMEARLNSR